MPKRLISPLSSSLSQHNPSATATQSTLETLLTMYGVADLSTAMRNADHAEHLAKIELQDALSQFQRYPTQTHHAQLMQKLVEKRSAVQAQYAACLQKRDVYQAQADAEKAQADTAEKAKEGSLAFLMQMKKIASYISSYFSGETPLQQVEKYQAEMNHCKQEEAMLTASLSALHTLELPSEEIQSIPADTLFPAHIPLSHITHFGFTFYPENPEDGLGSDVSVGDVDGDGRKDVLMGASARNERTGSAYLALGHAQLGSSGSVSLTPGGYVSRIDGERKGVETGYKANIVYFNGSPYMQLGAPSSIDVGDPIKGGRVYLTKGGPSWRKGGIVPVSTVNTTKVYGTSLDIALGAGGISAVDLNQNGKSDVLLGSPVYNDGAGQGYGLLSDQIGENTTLYLADQNSSTMYTIRFNHTDPQVQSRLGWVMKEIGDFNGDTYPDFVITAPGLSSIFVLYGGPGVVLQGEIILDNWNTYNGTHFYSLPDSFAGCSVSAIPSPHGNYNDLLISACLYGEGRGRIYIVPGNYAYGRQYNLEEESNLVHTLDGESTGNLAGYATSSVGAMAGDGVPYFAVTAPGWSNARGRTYIWRYENLHLYQNLSQVDGNNAFTVDGVLPGSWSGGAVSGGDNIHGDGKANVLISSGINLTDYSPVFGQSRVDVIRAKPYSGPTPSNGFPWFLLTMVCVPIPFLLSAAYACHKKREEQKTPGHLPLLSLNSGEALSQSGIGTFGVKRTPSSVVDEGNTQSYESFTHTAEQQSHRN